MGTDSYIYVYWLAGFGAVLALAVLGSVLRALLGLRLRRPGLELVACEELPGYLNAMFEPARRRLRELGFAPLFCLREDDLLAHEDAWRWKRVFVHARERTLAIISPTLHASEMPGCEVGFWSIYSDASVLITVNGRRHMILGEIPGAELVDPYAATLEGQLQAHLEAARRADARAKRITPSSDLYMTRMPRAHKEYVQALVAAGWVEPCPKKAGRRQEYALLPRRALRYVWTVLRGERRRMARRVNAELSARRTDIGRVAPEAEAAAYRHLRASQAREPLGWIAKTAIFLGSVALFSLAFGVVFSWQLVLILLGVLLFHELGHAFGMWLFGYRDRQILFIPFFGAAAMGRDHQARPHQRVIVALLGPVPGIVVGYALLWWWGQSGDPLIFQVAVVMLVLNYLNLLPLVPLDGGQVMSLALFERHPYAQVVFAVVSAVLFVAAAWFVADPVLWILPLILIALIPAQWRLARALAQARAEPLPADAGERLLRLFAVLRGAVSAKLPFMTRASLVQQLERRLTSPVAARGTALATLFAYAVLLSSPVLAGGAYLRMQGTEYGAIAGALCDMALAWRGGTEAMAWEPPDWEEAIEDAESDDARFALRLEAGDWYYDSEDNATAAAYYRQAFAQSEGFAPGDERRAEALTRMARIARDSRTTRERYREALAIYQASHGPAHARVADTLESLAVTYPPQAWEALPLLERALAIREALPDADPMRLGMTLSTLAYYQEGVGDPASARTSLERMLELYRALPAQEHGAHFVGGALQRLARFHAGREQYAQAESYWQASLSLYAQEDERGALHPRASAHTALGWIRMAQGVPEAALRYFEAAKRSNENGYEGLLSAGAWTGAALAPDLLDLAYAHWRLGDAEGAQRHYGEAMALVAQADRSVDAYLADLERRLAAYDWSWNRGLEPRRLEAHIELIKMMRASADTEGVPVALPGR